MYYSAIIVNDVQPLELTWGNSFGRKETSDHQGSSVFGGSQIKMPVWPPLLTIGKRVVALDQSKASLLPGLCTCSTPPVVASSTHTQSTSTWNLLSHRCGLSVLPKEFWQFFFLNHQNELQSRRALEHLQARQTRSAKLNSPTSLL